MPAFDIDSQSPGGSFEPQPTDAWSMPLGSIAGIRIYISYTVFVALAVLAGLVTMVANRGGNQDLPLVALLGVAIWGIGGLVQAIVHLCLHFAGTARSDSITIGLLGIESPNPLYRQYPWTAVANLAAACFSLTALVFFGAASLAIHMLAQGLDFSSSSFWLHELATPSLGFDAVENRYLTATWLFWIQAGCQAYPLPRNLGRGAIASAIALFTAEANDDFQVKLLRRFLQLIAIITLMIAMATMIADAEIFLPRWPILLLLSVYLWVSAGRQDLRDWITSVHLANADPVANHFGRARHRRSDQSNGNASPVNSREPERTPWISEMIDSVRMRQKRRRAKATLQREREEAKDAARLDQVLQRVSRHGIDSVSPEDRALLQRVSDNLRRDRANAEVHPTTFGDRKLADARLEDTDGNA